MKKNIITFLTLTIAVLISSCSTPVETTPPSANAEQYFFQPDATVHYTYFQNNSQSDDTVTYQVVERFALDVQARNCCRWLHDLHSR